MLEFSSTEVGKNFEEYLKYVVHTIPEKAESIVFPGLTVDLKKVFFEI